MGCSSLDRPTGGDSLLDVQRHISALLNTRQGTLPHMPEYGLPDMLQIYKYLPNSARQMAQLVKKQLDSYEPRLSHLSVALLHSEQPILIHLQITAQYKGEPVHWSGLCYPDGQIRCQ